jgi:hypothetical protein
MPSPESPQKRMTTVSTCSSFLGVGFPFVEGGLRLSETATSVDIDDYSEVTSETGERSGRIPEKREIRVGATDEAGRERRLRQTSRRGQVPVRKRSDSDTSEYTLRDQSRGNNLLSLPIS